MKQLKLKTQSSKPSSARIVQSAPLIGLQHLVSIGCVVSESRKSLIISQVTHGGPAHLSGRIAVGDAIFEIDHEPIKSLNETLNQLSALPTGTLLTLTYRRCNDEKTEHVSVLSKAPVRGELPGAHDTKPCGISVAINVMPQGVLVEQVTVFPGMNL